GPPPPPRAPGSPPSLPLPSQLPGGGASPPALTCRSTPPSATCAALFLPVVLAQALLGVVALLGVYLLVFRLTARRLFACLVASYLSINLYVLAWVRGVLSETLSATGVVLVFLGFGRSVRGRGQ